MAGTRFPSLFRKNREQINPIRISQYRRFFICVMGSHLKTPHQLLRTQRAVLIQHVQHLNIARLDTLHYLLFAHFLHLFFMLGRDCLVESILHASELIQLDLFLCTNTDGLIQNTIVPAFSSSFLGKFFIISVVPFWISITQGQHKSFLGKNGQVRSSFLFFPCSPYPENFLFCKSALTCFQLHICRYSSDSSVGIPLSFSIFSSSLLLLFFYSIFSRMAAFNDASGRILSYS